LVYLATFNIIRQYDTYPVNFRRILVHHSDFPNSRTCRGFEQLGNRRLQHGRIGCRESTHRKPGHDCTLHKGWTIVSSGHFRIERPLTVFRGQLEAAMVCPFGTGLISGIYDWNIFTVPQDQLNGATRAVPVGHVVGGGTVINGIVWNRGNVDDFNAWDSLQDGSSGWS
jgi:choline dehydrogenase-like flavoprotein